jgi:hypothetical protein
VGNNITLPAITCLQTVSQKEFSDLILSCFFTKAEHESNWLDAGALLQIGNVAYFTEWY